MQSDVALLVVSAAPGELETAFDRSAGGSARLHALAAFALGLRQVVSRMYNLCSHALLLTHSLYFKRMNLVDRGCDQDGCRGVGASTL